MKNETTSLRTGIQTLIPFCYTFSNGCRAVALVGKRSTRGRHKHCGSATVTFEGGALPPHMPREQWWEFYVALAVPLNVNPFNGEFKLFGLNRRGVTATIYWRQLRFDKKAVAAWAARSVTTKAAP